ncbi:MAG: hypothetical protein COB78_02780 [Hyphomicrobiales bacterium]|nr:MAG: hypothetical protein COB78_02780 [Hyphomicrobiales bacterium]
MPSILKTLSISLLVLLPLSGCSTSGTSTHAGNTNSNYVSLKGDKSKRLLVQGQEYFSSQNYGLAEKHFRQAVEVRADNATAWLGLAASLDQLGRFETADRAYAQLKDLKGNNPRVLNNMGYSYLLRGDYQKARHYLNKAQNLDPSLEQAQGNLHLLEKVTS